VNVDAWRADGPPTDTWGCVWVEQQSASSNRRAVKIRTA
jgi:hypothetical protein